MDTTTPDVWLENWLPRLHSATRGRRVLELGCDTGLDTRWLVQHGFEVIATDVSVEALQACARTAPSAECLHHDLHDAMPFPDATFGSVIASLCLHYFDWATTARAVAEIRRCMAPGGLFLCRVNSERDYLHGAGQGQQIEPGFYRQEARYAAAKRFFGAADLDRLFIREHWHEVSRREVTIHRYERPKIAWEVAMTTA